MLTKMKSPDMCETLVTTTIYACGDREVRRVPRPCPENHPQPWPEVTMGSSHNRRDKCARCRGASNGA
jgi:hypothetical protein